MDIYEIQKVIKTELPNVESDVINNRHYLHAHPEIGYHQENTVEWIRSKLAEMNIEMLDPPLGVIGVIPGRSHDRIIALRADIDALPIQEENDVPYRSQNPGAMHACGHDAHTAMLLGACQILKKHINMLPFDVLVIFQPAEEGPSPGGAKPMLAWLDEEGIVPRIRAIFGQHVYLDYPVGTIGWKSGPLSASTDEVYLRIKGHGGHAAHPDLSVDALSIGCKVVTALESFMSRRMDPLDSAVLSIGSFHAGTAINIIAETAEISGTLRCLQEPTRKYILDNIKQISDSVCAAFGATCEIKMIRGVPVTFNSEPETIYAKKVLDEILGKTNVFPISQPMMGAEDFAWFAKAIPACYVWLGAWSEGLPRTNHQSHFNIDERVLPVGVQTLTGFALCADSLI